MPLLGSAAMLLSFDIVPEAIPEHDDWHTHEHLPERLAIPGFLKGSRWVALQGAPRYLVQYEVDGLGTLTSAAYLARLNQPSAWTTKMMPHYRGMRRGLCTVLGSLGLGMGHLMRVLRFSPGAPGAEPLLGWLLDDLMPTLPGRPGIGSVHLLQGAAQAPMTHEQRIRGADAGVDLALLVSGYDEAALRALRHTLLGVPQLEDRGATAVTEVLVRLDYALARAELPNLGVSPPASVALGP